MQLDPSKQQQPRSLLRRIRTLASVCLTGILAVAFVLLGTAYISDRASKANAIVQLEPTLVLVEQLKPQSEYQVTRRFVGQIEPEQRTDMAFEFGGTVVDILVDEGDVVEAGQILARLDTRSLENQKKVQQAVRNAYKARFELATLTAERRNALKESGYLSIQAQETARFALAETGARIAEIDALLSGIELKLDKAVIRAPFRAYVGGRNFDEGGIVANGQPILTLMQTDKLNMRVGVPPAVARKLERGDPVEIEVLKQVFMGTIRSIRSDVDTATRTRTIILSLNAAPQTHGVVFGQTGRVRFVETVRSEGYWVPVSALSEGPRGLWSLKIVDRDGDNSALVRTESVEVMHLSDSVAYVRGTFKPGVAVVTTGQHRVTAGQRVRVAAR